MKERNDTESRDLLATILLSALSFPILAPLCAADDANHPEWGEALDAEGTPITDFATLEGDPFNTDPKKLTEIKVWGTALSGELHPTKR